MNRIHCLLVIVVFFASPSLSMAQTDAELNEKANNFIAAEKFEDAISVYRQLLQKDPRNADIHASLGYVYYRQGKYQVAHDELAIALKASPGNMDMMRLQAQIDLPMRNYDEMLSLLDPYLVKVKDDHVAYNMRGVALAGLGRLDEGLDMFSRAITLSPAFASAYLNRADNLSSNGKYATAIRDYDSVITWNDDYGPAYNKRGLAHYKLGHTDLAIADFNNAIRLDADAYGAYYNRGWIFYERHELAKAKSDFEQSLKISPRYAEPMVGLALIYNSQKDFVTGASYAAAAIREVDDIAWYHASYAQALIGKGDNAAGLAEAEKVLSLEPSSPDGFMLKTSALNNLQKYEEAIAVINAGIKIHPGNNLMYSLRAYSYKQAGRTDLAITDENKASQLTNGRSVALTGTNVNCLSGDCNNGFGTYQFPSGNKYVGHFRDQQREGEGVFYFANGERFEGVFHKNNKSQGTYRYLNGATYTGTYDEQDNELNGTITGVNNMRIPVINGKPQLPPEPQITKASSQNANEQKKPVKRVCRACWGRGSFSSHETFYDGGRKDEHGFTHFGETTTTLCGKCHGMGYIEVSQ